MFSESILNTKNAQKKETRDMEIFVKAKSSTLLTSAESHDRLHSKGTQHVKEDNLNYGANNQINEVFIKSIHILWNCEKFNVKIYLYK